MSFAIRQGSAASIVLGLLLSAPALPAHAQAGLENERAIETIIGSEVAEEETQAAADPQRVIDAIDRTAEAMSTVRKTTVLDKVDIVFLSDAAVTEGGPPQEILDKIDEKKADIEQLRQELEGNAMLYHALNSRHILMRDVLAIEFDERNVVIYAAAKPAE